jgi:tRNA (cytidine32/guanosine34-2'-O)-methyltransferase
MAQGKRRSGSSSRLMSGVEISSKCFLWGIGLALISSAAGEDSLATVPLPNESTGSSRQNMPPPAMRIDLSQAASSSKSSLPRHAVHGNNRLSLDSLTPPSASSPTAFGFDKSWDRKAPSPLPSPILLHPPNAPDGLLAIKEQDVRSSTPLIEGAVSPALSSSSKTDLFFGSAGGLPTPPKPLARDNSIGKGIPSSWSKRGDRSVSTPTKSPYSEAARASGLPPVFQLDPFSSPRRIVSLQASEFGVTEEKIPAEELSTLPTLPRFPAAPQIARRESHQISRESKRTAEEVTLATGDILRPVIEPDDLITGSRISDERTWKLEKRIGDGAFSSVWSASPLDDQADTPLAAVKLLARSTVSANARTRISFVREVEVLRHISHPGIVSYLSSFSTKTHHCLVLERLEGGELFELVSDPANRDRMVLPGKGDDVGEGFVRRLFGELCKAVGWLHEVHAVHRDIKLESKS